MHSSTPLLNTRAVGPVNVKALLPEALYTEVISYFTHRTATSPDEVEYQLRECLRYLYLISQYPEPLSGLFLPVEQIIDEIWHYLILQTREYRALCEQRLPGRFFIEHRSLPYSTYEQQAPNREVLIEQSLRWLPLYCESFGPFDAHALTYWTMARFLHTEMGLSLEAIATLGAHAALSQETAE